MAESTKKKDRENRKFWCHISAEPQRAKLRHIYISWQQEDQKLKTGILVNWYALRILLVVPSNWSQGVMWLLSKQLKFSVDAYIFFLPWWRVMNYYDLLSLYIHASRWVLIWLETNTWFYSSRTSTILLSSVYSMELQFYVY